MTKRTEDQRVAGEPPLRAVRRARGMSLREVATRAGVDAGQLSKVERGERQLSVDALQRVAAVLGLHELAALLLPYAPMKEFLRANRERPTCGFGKCAQPIVGALMVQVSEGLSDVEVDKRRAGVLLLCTDHWNARPDQWATL